MARSALVLVVLVSVTIAGCSGIQSPDTLTAEPTEYTAASPDEIPGVSNGTVTDAAALATANGAGIVDAGATIRITQTAPGRETRMRLTVAADGTSKFSRTGLADGGEATVAYYRNDTATYVRAETGVETNYRVVERSPRPLEEVNSSLETVLAAGDFTVATESTDSETVAFTADEFNTSLDGRVLDDATPESARLVLTRDGGIQNLTITGQREGQTVTYTYERTQAPVDHAPAPEWLADVPPTADLRSDLSTDVVDDSYLRIDHDGGDTVPRNTTLTFSTNGTAGTVTFDSPLEAGDSRYAYFAAGNGSLVVTDDPPAADATESIDSPASVTISTADGVTLLNAGMAWGSESASEGATSDAGGSGT